MKQYLLIQNNGLICKEDMLFMGSSTKRGDSSKIGQFGSGWKYAIPTLLRNNVDLRVFSGHREILIETKMVTHRNELIELVHIDGENSNNATALGPEWTPWMAFREIISNAIDEGGHKQSTVEVDNNFETLPDKTRVYIELNEKTINIVNNYENYFSFDRKAYFSNSVGTMYLKTVNDRQIIYRKGIRCVEDPYYAYSLFDMSFNDIIINESRLTNSSYVNREMQKFVEAGINKEVLLLILKAGKSSYLPAFMSDEIYAIMIELIKVNGIKVITESIKNLIGTLGAQANITIPSGWYNKLVDMGIVESPLTKLFSNDEVVFIETGVKPVNFEESKLAYYFRHIGMKVTFKYGKMEKEYYHNNRIILINEKLSMDIDELFVNILYSFQKEEFKYLIPQD